MTIDLSKPLEVVDPNTGTFAAVLVEARGGVAWAAWYEPAMRLGRCGAFDASTGKPFAHAGSYRLRNKPETVKVTGWVNLYVGTYEPKPLYFGCIVHKTREEALKHNGGRYADGNGHAIACINLAKLFEATFPDGIPHGYGIEGDTIHARPTQQRKLTAWITIMEGLEL